MEIESKHGPTGYYVHEIKDIETNVKSSNGTTFKTGPIFVQPYATNNCQMSVIYNACIIDDGRIEEKEKDEVINAIRDNSQGQILMDIPENLVKNIIIELGKRYPDYEILLHQPYNNPTGTKMSIVIFKWDKYDYEGEDEDDLFDDDQDWDEEDDIDF